MSELTESLAEHLPSDFDEVVEDADYGEETAAKNYGVPILKTLGLLHADYEEWIDDDNRPDFVWSDKDGVTRIVGEFKKPWDENESEDDPRYKINQGISEAEAYNDVLKLKYILVSDGRYIYLSNEYAEQDTELELDLLELHENPSGSDVEETAAQLQRWITDIYSGEWNEKPSERDISEEPVFQDFIEESRDILNNDLLNSIERVFDSYQNRYEEFEEERSALIEKRQELHKKYRGHRASDLYKEVIDEIAEDLNYDYEEAFKRPPKDVDKDKCIEEVEKFREELLGHRTEVSELEAEYKRARNWYDKWSEWLILTGKDYEDASDSEQEEIREIFQLQTLNVHYNRILLIRAFEDMGIIGQIISDGFIKFFDEKVQIRFSNRYIEPLITASRQAGEVYSPLFRRDTPHDWYHYEEEVLKSVLRRFDNFNFRTIDRDIFGEMYQQCLDREKRKRLGAYYTPHSAISVLLDYIGFTADEQHIKSTSSKALDPACGSGAFVLESMHRIITALENSGYDLSRDDDLHRAINTINTKLRGFDLDPFAVQLAQSNLLIRVLQERRTATSKNNGDDAHLQLPEFSVFETDSLLTVKEGGQTNKERYYRAHEKDPSRLDEIIEAKEDNYQFIFGNPPYVRSHNQDESVTTEYERLHETFGEEQSDVFVAFVEQALEWLDEGGQLAFVISNALLVTDPSRPAMKNILENATIDFVGDLTRCKIFGIDVNVFPILLVLTKCSGEDDEEVRNNNETSVAKIFPKGSRETNEWGHALDYAAAELSESRDEPDYDFEDDFEPNDDKYAGTTNEDTYEIYTVAQKRFTENWSSWSDAFTLNFQIDDGLWEVVTSLEDTEDCVKLENVCQMDRGSRNSEVPARGEEPRFFRPYETTREAGGAPVISGSNIEQFYVGSSPRDVEEYVNIDAIEADDDTDVSDNKLDVFKNRPRIAYRETASQLSFVVDDPQKEVTFYNKQAYFLLLNDSNGLSQYTEADNAVDPHYVCGLMNSDLLDFYYKAYYEHLSFRHAPAVRIRPSRLYHLPIYVPEDDEKEEIKKHSQAIHEEKRKLKDREYEQETLFETFQEDGRTVNFRDHIQSVTESRDVNLRTLDLEQDGVTVQLNSFYTVEMYDEGGAEELVEFLERFGEEYITGSKLRELELPDDLEEFTDEYEAMSEEINELEKSIETETEQLNTKVYDLYDVSEHRDDIEEYLDNFLKVIK